MQLGGSQVRMSASPLILEGRKFVELQDARGYQQHSSPVSSQSILAAQDRNVLAQTGLRGYSPGPGLVVQTLPRNNGQQSQGGTGVPLLNNQDFSNQTLPTRNS